MFPDEPHRFLPRDAERLFVWAAERGASDVSMKSGEQLILHMHGRKRRVTNRRLTYSEVMDLLVKMYGSESAKATLSGAADLDFPYELRPDRDTRYRFRVNATACEVDGGLGVEITARTIASSPPDIKTLGVESSILENMAPRQGMIVVAGATGSGKTTLLASIMRSLLEEPDGNRKILTYEAPIEYVYDEIDKPTSTIVQTQIGRHLPSFALGTRNALRRAPDVILVGEARDAETIGEAVTASMTGHALYTTVHATGFADTIRRMVNQFPEGEKNARAVDIVSSLRMVVAQRLVPSTDGRRVALREIVVINDAIVDRILDAGVSQITAICRMVLRDSGRSFLQDADEKYAQGRISERVYREIRRMADAERTDQNQDIALRLSQMAKAGMLPGTAAEAAGE